MSNHEDPLMQDDFDQTPSQRDGSSSGRFASESDAIESKKKKGKLIIFGSIIVVVGVVVGFTLHLLHQSTPVSLNQTSSSPVQSQAHPVHPFVKPMENKPALQNTALQNNNAIPENKAQSNPAQSNPAQSAALVQSPNLNSLGEKSSPTNPLASSNTSLSTALPAASTSAPSLAGAAKNEATPTVASLQPSEKGLENTNKEDLANNPLFANSKPVPSVAAPVSASSSLKPSGSTLVLPEKVSSVATVTPVSSVPTNASSTVLGSLNPSTSTSVDAPVNTLSGLSGQVNSLNGRVDQLDTRVTRLETQVGDKSVSQKSVSDKKITKAANKVEKKKRVVHKAFVHHYYKPKNDIEILSNHYLSKPSKYAHQENSHSEKLSPVSKPSSWSQTKNREDLKVSAVEDGRAWLKLSNGSFITVQLGGILPDGRKITKISDSDVWANGQKLSW